MTRCAQLFATAVLLVGVYLVGEHAGSSHAVCHAAEEDSVITDCDYRDGPQGRGFYPR